VFNAIQFLLSAVLITEKSEQYLPTNMSLHLSHESPLASRSHTNWRLAAIRSVSQLGPWSRALPGSLPHNGLSARSVPQSGLGQGPHSTSHSRNESLHDSTVSSLSHDDAEILRRRFQQQIEDYVKTVGQSAEEQLYCFNLDFFSLIR
jgi:hypothetical protein